MKRLALFTALSCLAFAASAQTVVDAPAQPAEPQVAVVEAAAPDAAEQAAVRELDDRQLPAAGIAVCDFVGQGLALGARAGPRAAPVGTVLCQCKPHFWGRGNTPV